MRKSRNHQIEELPLFDLPLREDHDGEDVLDSKLAGPGSPAKKTKAIQPPTYEDEYDAGTGNIKLFPGPESRGPRAVPPVPEAVIDPEDLPATVKLGDRFLAGLADLAAQLAALGSTLAVVLAMGLPLTLADWPPFLILALIFSFLYSVIPLAFWGQTAGMTWVGLLAQSSDGEPLSFSQTTRRWLGGLITLALVGLPIFLAISGRSLSDRLSGSKTQLL